MWCRRHPLPAGAGRDAACLAVVVGSGRRHLEVARGRRTKRATSEQINEFLVNRLLACRPRAGHARPRRRSGSAAISRASRKSRPRSARRSAARTSRSASTPRPSRTSAGPSRSTHGFTAPPTAGPSASRTCWPSCSTSRAEPPRPRRLARRNLDQARRALGPDRPDHARRRRQPWASCSALPASSTRPSTTLRETLATRRRVLEAGHPDTLRSVNHLGLLLQDRGKLAEADTLAHEYENGIRCLWGTKHPDNVAALANLGLIRSHQGKPAEAEPSTAGPPRRRRGSSAPTIPGRSRPKTGQLVPVPGGSERAKKKTVCT